MKSLLHTVGEFLNIIGAQALIVFGSVTNTLNWNPSAGQTDREQLLYNTKHRNAGNNQKLQKKLLQKADITT